MRKTHLLLAAPLALAFSAGAMAEDRGSYSASEAEIVETLKSQLPSIHAFEVEDIRAGENGVTCVTYHVGNDNGGLSQSRAVVKGDTVLREYNGNARFEKSWNKNCASR